MTDDVSHDERIYLDNAATSWPKPTAVYDAVDHYQRHLGAPAGRSGYGEAVEVSSRVEAARRQVASLLGLADPAHLIFTANGTDSLNLVLHGLLAPGDHVVTTQAEHNSVLRPLVAMQESLGIEVSIVPCNGAGYVDPAEVRAALRSTTRLVAVTHASNVTGAVQPVEAISTLAREQGALVLCDAAQSVGHMSVDINALGVDFLAAPGHKGLLGPLGTGVLAIHPQAASALHSVRQGGTGTQSQLARQPDEVPAKFESGNLNVPGILGLAAGVQYLAERGLDDIAAHGGELIERLLAGFGEIRGLKIYGPAGSDRRVPLVSIVLEGYDPQEVALGLDAAYRVQVRPGLHCAPLLHEAIGTHRSGGTVRFSLGPMTTAGQIDRAIEAVAQIAASPAWG